jgi:MoxR-like ATPase
MVVERVQVITTEDALLEHLKMIMDLSGHSTRTLHAALKKLCQRPPSHTTISNWLNAAKIPRLLTEEILAGMVTVFAEDLAAGTEMNTAEVVSAHVRTYRRLIVQRNTARFDAGPVPRALAALAAQEGALAPDDPARQHVRLARETLLRAVAADHEQPDGDDAG